MVLFGPSRQMPGQYYACIFPGFVSEVKTATDALLVDSLVDCGLADKGGSCPTQNVTK